MSTTGNKEASWQLTNHDQDPNFTQGTQSHINTGYIEQQLAGRFLGRPVWLWLNTKKLSTRCEVFRCCVAYDIVSNLLNAR